MLRHKTMYVYSLLFTALPHSNKSLFLFLPLNYSVCVVKKIHVFYNACLRLLLLLLLLLRATFLDGTLSIGSLNIIIVLYMYDILIIKESTQTFGWYP